MSTAVVWFHHLIADWSMPGGVAGPDYTPFLPLLSFTIHHVRQQEHRTTNYISAWRRAKLRDSYSLLSGFPFTADVTDMTSDIHNGHFI